MEQRRCAGCMSVTEGSHCQHCGWPAEKNNEPHQLPVGTVLRGQYMVGRVLGQGGFGITYLGWDAYLEAPVAIKEYYPSYMVSRDHTVTRYVRCYTSQIREQYAASKARFLREARTLAKFQDEPAVVHIRSCFEENDTAYIIMEYLHGETLADHIRRTGPMAADRLLELLGPVMEALEDVHQANIVHRDISPDNIMILPDGRAKLLDFGAARDSSNSHTTETVVKHGFAPFEQYQNKGDLGPWTDVYALCATLWYCLTGRIPTEALSRVTEGTAMGWDTVPGLTQPQRQVLEQGMAILHRERIQSVQRLLEGLRGPESGAVDLGPVRAQVEAQLRQELAPVIREELRRELRPQIEKELRTELSSGRSVPVIPDPGKAAPTQKPPKEKKKRKGAVAPVAALVAAALVAVATAVFVLTPKGWTQQDGHYSYRTRLGTKLTAEWFVEDGLYYYFDSEGHMVTDLVEVDGYTYYFGETDGRMRTGWQQIDGDSYYFGETDGRMRTGVVTIDGVTYSFGESDGRKQTGMVTYGGEVYYFDENDGSLCTGWQKIDDMIYYFDGVDGHMITGHVTIGGKDYTFSGNGTLIGWPKGEYPQIN